MYQYVEISGLPLGSSSTLHLKSKNCLGKMLQSQVWIGFHGLENHHSASAWRICGYGAHSVLLGGVLTTSFAWVLYNMCYIYIYICVTHICKLYHIDIERERDTFRTSIRNNFWPTNNLAILVGTFDRLSHQVWNNIWLFGHYNDHHNDHHPSQNGKHQNTLQSAWGRLVRLAGL